MKRLAWIAGLLLLAAGPLAAANEALPSSFGGWNAAGNSVLAAPANLGQLLGQNAALVREDSLRSVERRTYRLGNRTSVVTLYRFGDPSSAYGAYTFLRSNGLAPLKVGSFGSVSGNRALIVVGNYLVDATGPGARPSEAALTKLATELNKTADQTPYPTIGMHLPPRGLVPHSEHYILGPVALNRAFPLTDKDWIGFDLGAEAMEASYRLQGNAVKLLLVSYPTQQIAAKELGEIMRQFNFDPPGQVPPGQVVLFGKRSSSMVAIIAGAPNQKVANSLLDRISYEDVVTWNEPKSALNQPSFNSMVVEAFEGTGVIMLLCLVVSIGFGGIRVVLKIFFPHKIFDREKNVEILQLGLTSKPIHAKDLY